MAKITIEVSDEVATRLLQILQAEKGAVTNGAPPLNGGRRDVEPATKHDPMLAAWGAFADVPEEDWQEFLNAVEAQRRQQNAETPPDDES